MIDEEIPKEERDTITKRIVERVFAFNISDIKKEKLIIAVSDYVRDYPELIQKNTNNK